MNLYKMALYSLGISIILCFVFIIHGCAVNGGKKWAIFKPTRVVFGFLKIACVVLFIFGFFTVIYGDPLGDYGPSYNNSDYGSNKSSSYDYDKGYGYTSPKSGESLNDYIKRQDPDLYQNMQDRWNSLGD